MKTLAGSTTRVAIHHSAVSKRPSQPTVVTELVHIKIMIDLLPIEVWRYILEFACTDGGRTAISFSRVSRAFRSISTAYRFHSVRLSKLSDIQAFLVEYEAALATATSTRNDPPRVCRLLLSFLPGETDVKLLEGPCTFRDVHSWREAKDTWNARCVDLLSGLFALVGSHLETLAILQSRAIALPFVRCTLPALRTLTLLAEDRLFVRLPSEPNNSLSWMEMSNVSFYASNAPIDFAGVAAAPPFPALQRLHIVDVTDKDAQSKRLPWTVTLPVWAKLAPHLAILEFSNAAGVTVRDLRDLAHDMPPVFSTLRTLAVQPAAEDSGSSISLAGMEATPSGRDSDPNARTRSQMGVDATPSGHPPVKYVLRRPVPGGDDSAYWARRLAEEWTRWA
ncbi:hypothetical protein C2E23DRAFT_855453 [Lenzites betulinus]|nr:hypothetical protein C2E23DRAFT_855453 [Lenzites betulinus]